MSGQQFDGDKKAGPLPARTTEQVMAHAQAIYNKRGAPPYIPDACTSEEEAIVLSDFVFYWLRFLDRSKHG